MSESHIKDIWPVIAFIAFVSAVIGGIIGLVVELAR